MTKPFLCLGVLVATIFTCAEASRATVVTLTSSSADASIFSLNPDNSLGAGPGLFAGTDSSGSRLRSLLKFDIAANVPAGSTITDVKLTLHLGMVAGGTGSGADSTPRTIELHRLTQGWGEGTTGSTSTTINKTGAGFAANNGDATWNARGYSTTSPTLWNTAGGDFAGTASAATSVGQTADGAYDWTSTAALVADVQAWLNQPSTNNGWLLENPDETTLKTFRAFYSREASTAAFRPQLQVTFTPEPSGTLTVALMGMTVICRRKRSVYLTKRP